MIVSRKRHKTGNWRSNPEDVLPIFHRVSGMAFEGHYINTDKTHNLYSCALKDPIIWFINGTSMYKFKVV